jgi:hypothetical protein
MLKIFDKYVVYALDNRANIEGNKYPQPWTFMLIYLARLIRRLLVGLKTTFLTAMVTKRSQWIKKMKFTISINPLFLAYHKRYSLYATKIKGLTNSIACKPLISLVGTGRFELPTSTVSDCFLLKSLNKTMV